MKHLAPRNHKGSQLQKGPFTTNFSTTKTSTNFHTLPEAGLRKSIFCTHRVGKMKVLLALAAVVCVADAFVRMPGLRPAATQMRGLSSSSFGGRRGIVPRIIPRPARLSSRSGLTALKAEIDLAATLQNKMPDSEVITSSATNLAEVLADLWDKIVVLKEAPKEKSIVLAFPSVKALASPTAVNRLLAHMDICKDACDDFGSEVKLIAHAIGEGIAPGFEVVRVVDKGDGDEWDNWGDDDDDDWMSSPLMQKYANVLDDDNLSKEEKELERLMKVPKDDMELLKLTRDWVNVIVSDMGICPFSQSADKAGLPVGGVHYPISRVKTSEECYAVYWKEVVYLLNSDDREVSTTLLIIPEFGIGNIEGFTSFTDTLTSPLVPLGLERFIQLVYFHPQWVFRDGADRAGEGAAANFARRSPFPMINILRTPQVRLAQKSIPTGLVYTQNEETLADVGAGKLQDMLMDRNWDELADKRVDRRYNKLGKIAQMLMDTDGAPPEEVKAALDAQIAELEEARANKERSGTPEPEQPNQGGGGGVRF